MTNDSDLRKQAAQAITNYMHHEFLEIGGAVLLLELVDPGNEIMAMIDRAIAATRIEGQKRGLIP